MGTTKKNSFKDAAYHILKEADEPLSYKEISVRAMEQGLIFSEGKTPEATMGAQLYMDIRDNCNGEL